MPSSAFDSATFRTLFGDPETQRLFTDSAEIRAMLLVEGALARAQADAGLIPETAAAAIHRAALEVQIDPGALASATGENGVPVPALITAFQAEMQAPDHARYVHWGATSQDIIDTALILRLRQILTIHEARLRELIRTLGALAEAHADLPMGARTYGQRATPTSFGAVIASWGQPLLRHLDRLEHMRPRLLVVSLSGAAGTLSVMGDKGPEIRAGLAKALDLGDPGSSWHSARDTLAEISGWATGVSVSLGKMAEDLILMTQSGIGEVQLGPGGSSSTMPQKQNPVGPSVIVAVARHLIGLNSVMQDTGLHRQQRDGAAWFAEWLALPQICVGLGRALQTALDQVTRLSPDPDAMLRGLDDGLGLLYAEALTFALAQQMPRPEAASRVKALCAEARETGLSLQKLASREFPETNWAAELMPGQQLGQAPADAQAFARAASDV